MKPFFLLILFNSFLLTGCENSETTNDYPDCIASKIDDLKKAEIQNPPAEVWKWEMDNNTYYYITSDCCDQYNYLYTTNCKVVCAPDGGFTGNGDGNCPEFYGEVIKTLIWEDPRR